MNMRRTYIGFVASLLTFVIGVALVMTWVANRARPDKKPTPSTAESPVPERGAHLTSFSQIASTEIKEKNVRLGYELNVSYPQIANPKTRQERGFNLYVEKLVTDDVKSFRAYCSKDKAYSGDTRQRGDYHFNLSYEVLYSMPELLSVNLTEESYTGYLNSDWFPVAVNYDLKAGKPLALADLFKPKSKFLEAIASYCVTELERVGLDCGGKGGDHVIDEGMLRKGTLPKAENYVTWNLTRAGIQITFGEYQIGPGCVGIVNVVVPYGHLNELLRKDYAGNTSQW